jgi:hypothetical protein
MCRSIKTLRNLDPPASKDDIRAAARQFVRKVSGFHKPSQANSAAFDQAIDQIAETAERLLAELTVRAGSIARSGRKVSPLQALESEAAFPMNDGGD